jgi:septum formation protein
LKFGIVKSGIEEKLNPRLGSRAQAEELSRQKAMAVAAKYNDAIIIAADTLVVIDNEILGKPKDSADAIRMLKKLSGRAQEVITGFTIIDTKTNKTITKSVVSKLFMRKIAPLEIDAYTKREILDDKAGSYAINGIGAIFFERIDGDYYNIVGLPVYALSQELKKVGVKVLG